MKKQHYWLLATLAAVILGLVSLSGAVRAEASGEAKLSTTTSAVIGDKFELRLGFEEGTYTASDLRLVVSKRYGDEVIEPQGTIFHIPLNPEELTIDLQPRLMYGDTELDRRTTPYTGALFAKTLAGLDWMGSDVKEMLADLLEYGAAAQNYYNYRTDDPANAEAYRWDGYQPTAFQAPQPSAVTVTKEGTGVTLRSANLYLEGDTIAVQFRGTSPDNAVYTLNGTAVTPATYDAGNFMVRSAAIKMSEIPDASYTLRVSDGTNWSEVTYSVANYIANKTSDAYAATGNPYMVELAKRLWAYGGKANYVYENMTGTDYTIKFLDIDGAVLSDGTYSYGEAVAVPADQTRTANGYTYTFNGWGSTVSTVAVGDAVYKASFKAGDIVLDFDWYGDGSADTFTLEDPEDLYAFALISQTKNFAGKTVELGADIDLNPAWTASATAPANAWVSAIGNTSIPFAGTFDGKGHTIKGVYINAETAYQGLFRATDNSAVIKDFRLKNSYFTTTSSFLGSIAGNARGTFEKIYSNAFVSCTGTVQGGGYKGGGIGGLIGATADTGTVALRDCWFGGSVRITAQTSYLGGLIGLANNIPVTLENCLNTGELYHTWDGSLSTAGVGGLVSFAANAAAVTITDSVNHSEPQYTSGSVIGLFVSKKDSGATINITNGHSLLYKLHGGTVSMSFVNGIADATYSTSSRQNKADVAGTKSLTTAKVSNLFSSDTAKGHWVCSTDSLPILAAFEDEYEAGSISMDTSWYDASASEYILMDADDLYGFAALSQTNTFTGKTVKLGADITINSGNAADWQTAAPERAWMPIGRLQSAFNGTFDGQMHTISGLYADGAPSYQGMFAVTDSASVIKNLKLKNSFLTSTAPVCGSIVGRAKGTIEKVYSEAIVYGQKDYVGGIVGITADNGALTMRDCWFAGEATINVAASYLGGLIGQVAYASTIENCISTGEVYHHYKVGTAGTAGFVGYAYKNVTITDSVCITEPKTTAGSGIGYFAGRVDATVTLTNCHAVNWGKGFVNGSNDGYPTCTRQNTADVAGIKALSAAKVCTLFSSDTAKGHWVCSNDSLPVLKAFADEYAAGTIMMDTGWYGSSASEYELTDADDLFGFAALSQMISFSGKTVKLGADIDMNPGWTAGATAPERVWLRIGTLTTPFAGTFDGQGHTISGIYSDVALQYEGLFGVTESTAVIRDFKLKNSYFTNGGYGHLGSIAGLGKGTFEKIYSDAIVYGAGSRIGGLIGLTSSSGGITMKDCWFAGSATVNVKASYLGGLVGHVAYASTIENCLNTGEVYHKASVTTAGTSCFVGYATATVTLKNCVNHKNPAYTGGSGVGYFVGTDAGSSTLENCHSINWYDKKLVGDTDNANYPTCTTHSASTVKGLNAKNVELVSNLFTDASAAGHWICSNDSLPVLTYFAAEYAAGTISD